MKSAVAVPIGSAGVAPPLAVTNQGTADVRVQSWGWLPTLSLVGALGVLLVARGYAAALTGGASAELQFWAGLLVMFVPVVARLCSVTAPRHERIGLVVVLGLEFFLVKVLYQASAVNPVASLPIVFNDEHAHWRTSFDIMRTGHLFRSNPLLMVAPLYPGLGNVTTAIANLTGLSITAASTLTLAATRPVLMLALYRVFEEIGGSSRVAGIAVALYVTNPNFLFFQSQFAYESLALPLTMMTLLVLVRRARGHRGAGSMLALVLGVGAVVITHHLTSYALAALLLLWMGIAFARGHGLRDRLNPWATALVVTASSLAWLLIVANRTVGYLAPVLKNAVTELFSMIIGEATRRELFRPPAGTPPAAWERLAAFGSIGLIMLGLPFGLLRIWLRHRTDVLFLVFGAGALAYPGSLALRLTAKGGEVSQRASEFLFLPLGFVLALAIVAIHLPRSLTRWIVPSAFATVAAVLLLGSVVAGRPPWLRMPGPYLVGADPRSIDPQGVAAAEWTRTHLGPDNRMLADRVNRLLMGSYGVQYPVTQYGGGVSTSDVVLSPDFGEIEQRTLYRAAIRYVVIDHRLSTALPMTGVYFEGTETGARSHVAPIDPVNLAKLDGRMGANRIFDTGDIEIYDVEALANGQ